MKSIILVLALLPASAWGEVRPCSPTEIEGSTWAFRMSDGTRKIMIANEVMSLSEFVSSGEFCKWRGGHEWADSGKDRFRCKICKKRRRVIGYQEDNLPILEGEFPDMEVLDIPLSK